MHWADVMAEKLSHRGSKHIIASGITPSGEFHIGHIREILTGHMITKACQKRGLDAEFVFIVDSADPLRKIYPFLSEDYQPYIGHPLATIPAPLEDGSASDGETSYAQHFLEPFLKALKEIGVEPRIIDNYNSYATGEFASRARIACEKADEIREIIERVSGRELSKDWFPYNPIGADGSMDDVLVTGFEWPYVHWNQSGIEGKSDLRKAEGKLPWRIDWPARWGWIGITCEPFGKDHGTAGGSYSTGREISILFGDEPPMPLTYEWISLRGQGAMSSSTGNTIGPLEALELVPPQILLYLIARSKPNKAIDFDPGVGLVELADEFERLSNKDFNAIDFDSLPRRKKVMLEDEIGALSLSKLENLDQENISFRHLAMLAQIKSDDEIFSDFGDNIADQLSRMRHWIQGPHFPDSMRITVRDKPMPDIHTLPYVKELSEILENCEWNADTIGKAIPTGIKNRDGMVKDAYKTLYMAILNREKGPRLASILYEIGREKALHLLGQT